jgi:hypothetical protein
VSWSEPGRMIAAALRATGQADALKPGASSPTSRPALCPRLRFAVPPFIRPALRRLGPGASGKQHASGAGPAQGQC